MRPVRIPATAIAAAAWQLRIRIRPVIAPATAANIAKMTAALVIAMIVPPWINLIVQTILFAVGTISKIAATVFAAAATARLRA
jgi:hypothetical protein